MCGRRKLLFRWVVLLFIGKPQQTSQANFTLNLVVVESIYLCLWLGQIDSYHLVFYLTFICILHIIPGYRCHHIIVIGTKWQYPSSGRASSSSSYNKSEHDDPTNLTINGKHNDPTKLTFNKVNMMIPETSRSTISHNNAAQQQQQQQNLTNLASSI